MSKPEDLNFFTDLLSDMDSLENNTPVQTTKNSVSVNENHQREMLKIASSISDLLPDETNDYTNINKPMVNESHDFYNSYNTVPQKIVEKYIPITHVNFEVIHTPVNGLKSLTNYSVVVKETSQPIISDIYLKECAYVVADFLNNGKNLSDVKILGILGSAIQYTNVMTEAYNVSKKRHKVLRESNYDLAKDYDEELKNLAENANTIKEKVLKFLKEQGYV